MAGSPEQHRKSEEEKCCSTRDFYLTSRSRGCPQKSWGPTPGDGGTDAVNVTSSIPSAPIAVTLSYKTTTSHDSGTTDGSGAGTVPFGLGGPTPGYTVDVSVNVGGQAGCSTSFTPK